MTTTKEKRKRLVSELKNIFEAEENEIGISFIISDRMESRKIITLNDASVQFWDILRIMITENSIFFYDEYYHCTGVINIVKIKTIMIGNLYLRF